MLIHQILLKINLASSKLDTDQLNIDKLEKAPSALSSLKSKVDELDVEKLVPVPVVSSKLSDIVKFIVVKKTVCDELVKKVKTTDTSDLVQKGDYDTKIDEIEKKITDHDIVISILLLNNLISW